jgi:hypothetical protein
MIRLGSITPANIMLGTQQVSRVMLGAQEVWSNAPAFVLGWESPVSVSTVGDSIIATDGVLIEARNLGQTTNRTVNGVLFLGQTSRDQLNSGATVATAYQDGVIGADFEGMMDSFAYSGSIARSITLVGLQSGKTYLLQIFVSDDRNPSRTQAHSLGGYDSDSVSQAASFSMICRFVATGTTENMLITPNVAPIINGFQVRQLD